jgi:hypothetical protein
MSTHFLLLAKARTRSLVAVMRMTNEDAETWSAASAGKMGRRSARIAAARPSMSAAARPVRSASVAKLPQVFQHHQWDTVRPPQDAAPQLPPGHCNRR